MLHKKIARYFSFFTNWWKKVLIEGEGTITLPSGERQEGVFSAGKLLEGSIVLPDGDLLIGLFLDGHLEGKGKIVTSERQDNGRRFSSR